MPATNNDPDAIVDAASDGNLEAVIQCLARGDDVNAQDHQGRTALHVAAEEARLDIVETLLGHGANVTARNAAGDTPLDYAVFFRRADIADLLRKHGAVDRQGQSALQYNRDTEAIGWSSMQSLHKLMDEIKRTEPQSGGYSPPAARSSKPTP